MLWNRGWRKKEEERIYALEKATEGLRRGLDDLSKDMRSLTLDWELTYEKLNKLMGRLNARIRKSEATIEPQNDEPVAPQPSAPPFGSHRAMNMARMKHGLLPR